MIRKLCIVLAFVIALVISGFAYADNDTQYVIEESARRDMKIITYDQAKEIALKRVGKENTRVKEIDLDNEADDYPDGTNFRPVYQIECISGYDKFEIDIDAVTGEVLKFKLDD